MRIHALTSMLAALLISGCAIAPAAKTDDDHSAHHPPEGSPATAQPAPASALGTQAYERQMKVMQEMHLKLQAAKTPAERAALMSEHMKLMQAGMSMMGAMRGMGSVGGMGGPAGQSPQGGMGMMNMHTHMERRMAMMEQMMQMMVDRQAAMPDK